MNKIIQLLNNLFHYTYICLALHKLRWLKSQVNPATHQSTIQIWRRQNRATLRKQRLWIYMVRQCPKPKKASLEPTSFYPTDWQNDRMWIGLQTILNVYNCKYFLKPWPTYSTKRKHFSGNMLNPVLPQKCLTIPWY